MTQTQAPAEITEKQLDAVHKEWSSADFMADECRQTNHPAEQQWRNIAELRWQKYEALEAEYKAYMAWRRTQPDNDQIERAALDDERQTMDAAANRAGYG
jgi:hypothetical protein